jgi:hypothetical protein
VLVPSEELVQPVEHRGERHRPLDKAEIERSLAIERHLGDDAEQPKAGSGGGEHAGVVAL